MVDRLLITRILIDKKLYHKVIDRGIRPELFTDDPSRKAFDFVMKHYGKYGKVPELHILKRAVPEFKLDLSSKETVAFLCDELVTRREYGIMKDGLEEIADCFPNINLAKQRLTQLTVDLVTKSVPQCRDVELVATMMEGISDYRFRASVSGLLGTPTGWDLIDACTLGHQEQEMYFYVGRPNMGKTWILLYSLLQSFLYGEKVVLFVREQSAKVIRRRLHYLISKVPYNKFLTGTLSKREKIQMFKSFVRFRSQRAGNFFIIAENATSVADIRSTVERIRPTMIGVDGLALFADESGELTKRTDRIAANVPYMKNICQTFNVKGKLTNQMSRSETEFGASLDTIAFSDVVSQDSDVVVYLGKTPKKLNYPVKTTRLMRLIKCKEGGLTSFPVFFNVDEPKTFCKPIPDGYNKFSAKERAYEETAVELDDDDEEE